MVKILTFDLVCMAVGIDGGAVSAKASFRPGQRFEFGMYAFDAAIGSIDGDGLKYADVVGFAAKERARAAIRRNG